MQSLTPPRATSPYPFTQAVSPLVAPWVKPEGEEEAEPPPPEPVKVSFTFPGEEEPVETEPVEPGEDGAVVFDYVKALEGRVAGPALVSALIGTPLVVTVHRGEAAIATASVDMFAFTTGVESIGGSYALAKIPFEGDLPKPEPEAPPEGEEPPAEADAGGEGEDAAGEEEEDTRPKNPMLDGATIELSVTPTFPPEEGPTLVAPHDAEHGGILTLTAKQIAPLPQTLIDTQGANDNHWEFVVAVPLEGLEPAMIRGGETIVEKDEEGNVTASRVEFAAETSTAKVWMPAATFASFRDAIRGKGPAQKAQMEVCRVSKSGAFDAIAESYRAIADATFDGLLNPGATESAETAPLRAPPFGQYAASCVAKLCPKENPGGGEGPSEEPAPEGQTHWIATPTECGVTFEVTVSAPVLPPWRAPLPPKMAVRDLLPGRDPLDAHEADVRATEHFRAEVTKSAAVLSKEYAAMFTGEPKDADGKATRRKSLVFELNRSGKYHAMKERLKSAASAIIAERFHKGGEGVQGKYNELYVHLVQEMHAALKKLGQTEEEPEDPKDGVDHAKLARFKALADEYEIAGDQSCADKWHRERLVLTRRLPEIWADYGAFLARSERYGKSEEAYKEALMLDEGHVPSLTALCALMLHDEEYERAEVYGQAVTLKEGGDPVAWSLLAATYNAMERDEDATNCNYEARRLAAEVMSHVTSGSPASQPEKPPEAFVSTSLLLLDMHMPAEACAILEQSRTHAAFIRSLCLARAAMLEGMPQNAHAFLMDALSVDATDPRPFELLGDLHSKEGNFAEAEEAYTHAMACTGAANGRPPASLKLILGLGNALTETGKLADARATFEAGCEMCPCASTWLGGGIAMLRQGDLDAAEAALAEANIQDHTNARVWGYLCLVALLSDRAPEAEQAIGSAFRCGLADDEWPLLGEIGKLFLEHGRWKHAEGALRRSVKHGGGADVRYALGRALHEQGDAAAARDQMLAAVDQAAEAGDAETQRLTLESLRAVHSELGENEAAEAAKGRLKIMGVRTSPPPKNFRDR